MSESKKAKAVLALDQSTTATGWSLFKDERLVDYGVFKPAGDRDKRINDMKSWLEHKIEELSLDVDLELALVLEDIQMQQNVETFKVLAHLQGVLINVGYRMEKLGKIKGTSIYFASEWKATCKIAGKLSKEQKKNAQKHIADKYKVKVTQDTCDAICLGEHHIYKDSSEINFG